MNPPELPPENVYRPPSSWGEPPPFPLPLLPPAWPKVIGITAIVLSSYGLLTNGAGIFMSKMMAKLAGGAMAKAGFTADVFTRMEHFTLINSIGGMVVASLLLAAGIALVRQRPLSRRLFLGWAIVRLGLAAVIAPLMFDYMSSMMNSMTAGIAPPPGVSTPPGPGGIIPPPPAAVPAVLAGVGGTMAIFSVVMGTAMVCVLPGFVLIWFNRHRVKEYMDTWPVPKGPAAAPVFVT